MSDQDKPKNILRRKPKKGYTTLSNEIIEDRELSYRARGVALLLLSKPDDWEIRFPYLVDMGTEGRDAVRKAMHELSDRGYLKRERTQDENGELITVTLIADYPAFIDDGTPETRRLGYEPSRSTENPYNGDSRSTDFPYDGKPERRKTRTTENQEVIVITDLPSTDLPTTEENLPNTDAGGGANSTPSVSGSVGAPSAQNDFKDGAVGKGDAAAGRFGLDGLSGECRRAAVRFMAIVGRDYLTGGEYNVFWHEGKLGADAVGPHDHDWLLGNIERDLAAGKLDKYGDDLGAVLKWRYKSKHERDAEGRTKSKAAAVSRPKADQTSDLQQYSNDNLFAHAERHQ